MKDILAQALANYKELWNDWLLNEGDGSWNRTEVEKNIREMEELVNSL